MTPHFNYSQKLKKNFQKNFNKIEVFITKEYIMELNRFNQLLESTMGNVKPLIMEQSEKQVAGPFGKPPVQYYIFDKNGKFFIYQTNATVKTPTLLQGTLWNNNGPGYNTQDEANKVIQAQITPQKKSQSYQDIDDKEQIMNQDLN